MTQRRVVSDGRDVSSSMTLEDREALLNFSRGDISAVNENLLVLLKEIGHLFAFYLLEDPANYPEAMKALRSEILEVVLERCEVAGIPALMKNNYYLRVISHVFNLMSRNPGAVRETTALYNRATGRAYIKGRRVSAIRNSLISMFGEVFSALEARMRSVADVLVSKGMDQPIRDTVREELVIDQISRSISESGDELAVAMEREIVEIFRLIMESTVQVEEEGRRHPNLRRRLLEHRNNAHQEL